jgi:hypothetical protein
MGIMDKLFGNTQQVAPAPAPNPAAPGAALAPQNPAASPNGIQQTMDKPAEQNLPLDNFKDIWQTPANATPADPWSTPVLSVDPAQIQERVKTIDFTRSIDPARAQAALGGDPNALMEIINSATRNAFEMSLQMNAASVNAAGNTLGERVKNYMPEAYKQQQLQSAPVSNPVLEHPSAQPLLQATRQQIARQNPTLSVAEVNKRAEQYFSDFSAAFTQNSPAGRQATEATQRGAQADDFSNW